MKIIECEQGTDEWLLARSGKVTASCFKDAIAQNRAKTGPGVSTEKYMNRLLAERMGAEPQETYSNDTMDRGSMVEQEAREEYEEATGYKVTQVGFVERDEDVGCSPDGLVGDDGMIEIKCPNSSTHIGYCRGNRLPTTYVPQVQGQLWVCERKWCDFVSYDPRIKDKPYFRIRVKRDEDYIKELEIKIRMFTMEMKRIFEKLNYSPL